MSEQYIDRVIEDVIEREGGYVDHPDDRGGPTKFGITQRTLGEHHGASATKDDVSSLTRAGAKQIYRQRYWYEPGFDALPGEGMAALMVEALFDTGVHSGPGRAVRLLQRSLGTKEDGIIGPVTESSLAGMSPDQALSRFLTHRAMFLGELIGQDQSQRSFRAGWANRVAEFVERSTHVSE